MKAINIGAVLIVSAFGLASLGLIATRPRMPTTELLVFTELGRSINGDKFQVIDMNGRRSRFHIPLFNEGVIHSASSTARSGVWVLLLHATSASGSYNRLYSYRPGDKRLNALTAGDALEGRAVISPSSRLLVYSQAPRDHPSEYSLWLMDLETGHTKPLSRAVGRMWDSAPSWSPDEKKIAFVRTSLSSEGARSRLMAIDVARGEETEVLPYEDGVVGVGFGSTSSRLSILTRHGVELFDLSTRIRTLILPISALSGRAFRVGGISWSPMQNQVAISLFDRKSWRSEVWLIPAGVGGTPKSIYTTHEATIEGLTFVEDR